MESYLIHIVHLILGIILFFIINWIGKNSFSVGYMQISVFVRDDNAPAFNSLIRILTPVAFILLVSVILYKLKLDSYVKNIYLVSIYYLSFRLLFNLLTNRGLLINWGRQIFYWLSIISLSYYIYQGLILDKKNLFPDLSSWTNEIWVIVLIFIYNVFNRIKFTRKHTLRRKDRYLRNRYTKFSKKYSDIIDSQVSNDKLKAVIYSIMIYEDFNRPKLVRLFENAMHSFFERQYTLGLMQIKTDKSINDIESVEMAVRKISTKHLELVKSYNVSKKKKDLEKDERRHKLYIESGISMPESSFEHEDSDWEISHKLIKNYNPDYNYVSEINELVGILMKMYYSDSKTNLNSK